MSQKSIVVESLDSGTLDNTELNESFKDGWRFVAMAPQAVATSTSTTTSYHTERLRLHGSVLVILEKL